jgi:hypothetical protein
VPSAQILFGGKCYGVTVISIVSEVTIEKLLGDFYGG